MSVNTSGSKEKKENSAKNQSNAPIASLSTANSSSISSSTSAQSYISFCYTWTTRLKTRKTADGEATILSISPKFATCHQLISFQWNIRMHATLAMEGEEDINYIAIDLYLVDGPVNEVKVLAEVGNIDLQIDDKTKAPIKSSSAHIIRTASFENSKRVRIQKGIACEITDINNKSNVSKYLKDNIGNIVKVYVIISMETRLFEPFTYLDAISPTPRASFLTVNYNARVNSKIWKRRSRKRSSRLTCKCLNDSEKETIEKKVQAILDVEIEKSIQKMTVTESTSRRASLISQFRENQHEINNDGHIFKRILVSCCESCEQRRRSLMYESRTEDELDEDDELIADDDEPHFECDQRDKEHVHDMLANLYFNKVALPQMEFIEDFVDFLIDAELNDLPVLKRACERYLCSELNTKKDISTCLLLDLLFNSIVFNLMVMKSMTLSELANRTHEFVNIDNLLQLEEYQNLDKRMRNLADRSLTELIEQCVAFRDQKARVRVLPIKNENY